MTIWTSMLQIWEYEYSCYFYFVIYVDNFTLLLYAINLGGARLFVDLPFSVFSSLKFLIIWFSVKKKLFYKFNGLN
jgi:hypothetical protein